MHLPRLYKAFLLACSLVLLFTLSSSNGFLSSSVGVHAAPKTKSPTTSGTLAKNKLSVTANFSNLTNVKTVKYRLVYDASNGKQGASGTIKVASKNKNLSRKLLLGTCSKNVCTYHKSVKNIKLSVDYTLKSGGIISYTKTIK